MTQQYTEALDAVRRSAKLSGNTVWGERQRLVLKRLDALEAQLTENQTSTCSYCGHETKRAGRSMEDFVAELGTHVISCESRPEKKLASALLSIVVPLGIDLEALPQGDIDAVVAAVDKRWKEVVAMIPVPDAANASDEAQLTSPEVME